MEERMVILHQGETCGQLAEPLRRICVLEIGLPGAGVATHWLLFGYTRDIALCK